MIFNDLQWHNMWWHVETCWNMLKLLNRSQDSAPRADHRPRPHPLEVCTRISQKAQTIERPVAVSACVSHVSFWIALSCQVLRVIVLLPCQQNVCAKQWVWFRRLKDLQHAHFKNILEYIKCGFQHIFRMLGFTNLPISIIVNGFTHTNQTRSAPKSWCCMAGHIFWSRDPSACGPSRAAAIPWDELPCDFKQSWSLSDSAFWGIWWYKTYKYRQYRLMFLSYMMSYDVIYVCAKLKRNLWTLEPH